MWCERAGVLVLSGGVEGSLCLLTSMIDGNTWPMGWRWALSGFGWERSGDVVVSDGLVSRWVMRGAEMWSSGWEVQGALPAGWELGGG